MTTDVSYTAEAERYYREMSKPVYSLNTVRRYANRILYMIQEGDVSWDKLSFKEQDVYTNVIDAATHICTEDYQFMSDSNRTPTGVYLLAFRINHLLDSGISIAVYKQRKEVNLHINWNQLGFTKEDVAEKLRLAQTKE